MLKLSGCDCIYRNDLHNVAVSGSPIEWSILFLLGVGGGDHIDIAPSEVGLSLAMKSVLALASTAFTFGANTGVLHVGELLGLGGGLGTKGDIAPVVVLLKSRSDGLEILLVCWLAGVLGTYLGIVLGVGLFEGPRDGLENLLAGRLVLSGSGGPLCVLVNFQAGENTCTYFSEVTCLRVEMVATLSS